MDNNYFIILICNLKILNNDLNDLIGLAVKNYYKKMVKKRELNYKPIHKEMFHKWIFENTHVTRWDSDEFKYELFEKLRNRDERNDFAGAADLVDKYIHPGRSV